MAVIINYWVLLTPDIEDDTAQAANVQPPDTGSPGTQQVYGASVDWPALNTTRQDTRKMLRNYPQRFATVFPPGLWNCYARGEGLHVFTAMREDLQRLNEAYPDNFKVVGCWDYTTGEPIGGVGSPWFTTPPSLADIMPGIPQPGPEGEPPQPQPPPLFGVLHDIVLGAGQGERKFV